MLELTFYERQELADIIRRDLHHEQDLCRTDKQYLDLHRYNTRRCIDMLELLLPKHSTPVEPAIRAVTRELDAA